MYFFHLVCKISICFHSVLVMTRAGDEEDPFPVDDGLFAETFCLDSVFEMMGEEVRIKQVFGANLGVAAPVWEAVRVDAVLNIFFLVVFRRLLRKWCSDTCMCKHAHTGAALVSVPGGNVGGAERTARH